MLMMLSQGLALAYCTLVVSGVVLDTYDTQALQLSGEDKDKEVTAPKKVYWHRKSPVSWRNKRKMARLAAASEKKSQGWIPGNGGENGCPAGAVPLSQAECMAIASMDRTFLLGGQMSVLNPTFPSDDADSPKGCYWEFAAGGTMFSFNTHRTGAPDTEKVPSCKTNDYTIGHKACPAGYETVNPTECFAAADAYEYLYDTDSVSDTSKPPGCFGQGGYIPSTGTLYYNTNTAGRGSTNTYPFCKPSAATPAPSLPAIVPFDLPTPQQGLPGLPPITPFDIPQQQVQNGGQAPSPLAPATAKGDPHMTTISGVKFDIMRVGSHNLVHIPQGAALSDTLLDVQSFVSQEGPKCEDMYIKVLNITGTWVDGIRAGGYSFVTESPNEGQLIAPAVGVSEFMHFGIVDLKVVRGKTTSGVRYLNMFARHLRETSKTYNIGGILGMDDHTLAETPTGTCSNREVLSLLSASETVGAVERSVAEVE